MSQQTLNKRFVFACSTGNIKNVMKLLTSPDVKDHADIHTGGDWGFKNAGFHSACANHRLEVIQYLLTSPDLQDHNYFTDFHKFTSLQDFVDAFGEEFTIEVLDNLPAPSCERLMSSPEDADYAYQLFIDNSISMPDNLSEFAHLVEVKPERHQEIELHL